MLDSFFTTTAYRLYLAGLFLLPTAVVLSVVIPMQSMKLLIAAVAFIGALACAVLGSFKRGGLMLPVNWLLGAVWLLPLVYLVSSMLAPSFNWSLVGGALDTDTVFFTALLALAASLPIYLFGGKSDYVRAFFVLLIGAWLIAIFHLLRLFFGAEAFSFGLFTNPLFSPLGKWNDVAIFFGLVSLLSLITLEALPLKSMHQYILGATLVVSLFFVSVVNFVPVWAVLAVISLGIVLQRFMLTRDSRLSIAATVVFVVSVVSILFTSSIGAGLGTAFGVEQIEARPSWESTIAVAVQSLRDNPVLGSGPNTFLLEWDQYRPELINQSIFWNADFTSGVSMIATSAITTGVLGIIVWLVIAVLFILAGVRSLLIRPPEDPALYHLTMASFAGALYMLLMALLYLPSAQLALIGFALLGIFAAISHRDGGRTIDVVFRDRPRMGFVAVLSLALTLVISVVVVYGTAVVFASNVQYERAVQAAQSSGDTVAAAGYLDAANALYPEDRYYRLGVLVHLADLNALVASGDGGNEEDQQKFQTSLGRAVESGLSAVQLNSANYRNWQALSSAYQSVVPLRIDGAYEASANALDSAAALNPTMPSIPFARAQLEIANQDSDAAREAVLEALEYKEDFIPALLLLAQLELETGNLDEAIKRAEAASVFEPSNAVTRFQVGILKFENGDLDGAEAALKAAVELAPEYANARFYLGRTYEEKGDVEAALREYQKVEELNPGNAEINAVIDALTNVAPPAEAVVEGE